MDSNFSFSFDLPFKKKCSLPDCSHTSAHVSRVTLDGNILDFCTPEHARLGKSRWEEKKKMGIFPTPKKQINTNPIEEEAE